MRPTSLRKSVCAQRRMGSKRSSLESASASRCSRSSSSSDSLRDRRPRRLSSFCTTGSCCTSSGEGKSYAPSELSPPTSSCRGLAHASADSRVSTLSGLNVHARVHVPAGESYVLLAALSGGSSTTICLWKPAASWRGARNVSPGTRAWSQTHAGGARSLCARAPRTRPLLEHQAMHEIESSRSRSEAACANARRRQNASLGSETTTIKCCRRERATQLTAS
jgi:hypothetical protein